MVIHTPPLAKKHVLITGVSQGLGRAMVDEFTDRGWVVLGCARNKDKIEKLNKHEKNRFDVVDVSDQQRVDTWCKNILTRFGVPELVINNASLIDNPRTAFTEANLKEIEHIVKVNLFGPMYVTHTLLPFMQQFPDQTKLINISSGWGRHADSGLTGYCSSKFAIEGFSQVLAKENKQVIIVSLDPREGIATPMLAKCASKVYYNSRLSATEWAKIAVPYMLSIDSSMSGKALTCPANSL